MALSALDFPFCFLAVRWLGTERIGRAEEAIVEWVKRAVPVQIPEPWREWWQEKWGRQQEAIEQAQAVEAVEAETAGVLAAGYDHGVKEAEAANKGDNASRWSPTFSQAHLPVVIGNDPRISLTF